MYDQDDLLKEVNKVDHLGHDYDNNNKVFVNFLRIKSICNKCHLYFSSKLTLHKHQKTKCFSPSSRQLTKSSNTKQHPPFPLSVLRFFCASKKLRYWLCIQRLDLYYCYHNLITYHNPSKKRSDNLLLPRYKIWY